MALGDRPFSPLAEKALEPFQATIITLAGTVTGSKGRGYLNYLPLGGGTPGQAWNMGRVQERANVPVWIGYFKDEPVILHIDRSRMEPNGERGYRSPLFSQHAPDHGWGSGDPDYVDTRRIKDLQVRPAGLLTVKVSPGWYDNGLTYAYYAGQASLDLASYQPAVGTKRGVGLYLDSDGALQSVAGGVVARTAVLPEPSWPDGVLRLAAVILFGDKTFIDFEYIKQRKALWSNPTRKVSSLVAADGSPDPAWSVDNDGNLSNPGLGDLSITGDINLTGLLIGPATESVFKVKNTSGATAAANETGYLSEAGEYKTTTTAALVVNWCTVVIGGANNADIYVANRGRFTVKYTGTAPSAGHYLTTSTVAGSALRSTVMDPAIFAVCLAAGSGGLVEVLLLCSSVFQPLTNANDIARPASCGLSNFTGTINGTPSGSTLVYTITGGTNEESIKPFSSSQIAKLVLYNTTRGTSLLISSVDIATNTITFTTAVPGAWVNTDVITARSQINTLGVGSAFFYDHEFAAGNIPVLTRAIDVALGMSDSGGAGQTCGIHPYEAGAASKLTGPTTQSTQFTNSWPAAALINNRITLVWTASGSATALVICRLRGVWVAAP